jgi:SHS2 domain-containing protein
MTVSDRNGIFRELNHAGDLRVEIFGKTEEELFQNAVRSLYSLLGLPEISMSNPRPLASSPLTFSGMDREDVLVQLLGELLFVAVTEKRRWIPGKCTSGIPRDSRSVSLVVEGTWEDFPPEDSKWNTEIKAVTYHDTKIVKQPEGYVATVVMDL